MDPFEINEDLTAYSAQEIDDLIADGESRLDALLAIEEPTNEQADEADSIYAALERLSSHRETLSAEPEVSASERMAALRSIRVEASNQPEGDEDGDDEDDEDDEDGDEGEGDDGEPVEAAVKPVVAAAKRRTRTARETLSGKRPARVPEQQRAKAFSMTASADVSGVAIGSDLPDLDAVANVLTKRLKGLPQQPTGDPNGQLQRYGVAFINRSHEFSTNNTADDYAKVMEAAKESRLKGGSLIAAGGWCAPSEVLYDLCEGETTDGLIDLPEVGVSRGGIRFTQGPQFVDLYNAGFTQTEAQAISGTTKPCYEVACPSFTEVRLDAMGICIKVPLLTNAAYPELTRRTISGSLTAHLHRVSAGLIAKMATAAGAAIVTSDVNSTTGNTLDSVALIATTLRQQYRLGITETLEVVAPQWLREAIRADLAMRNGVEMLAVTNQQIDAFFAARMTRVQWVYNWQDLTEGQEGYPTTANLLVYPAGTFVRGSADVINLDAVYDAASLSVNTMTGLFFEEGVLLAQTCFKAKQVTVNVKSSGVTGAASNAGPFNLVP